MTRVLISGFEGGDYRADGWVEENFAPVSLVGGGGRRSLQNNGGNFYCNVSGSRLMSHTLGVTLSEAYVRFAYAANDPNTSSGGNGGMFRFKLGSTIVASLGTVDAGSGYSFLQVYNGSGSLLQQSVINFPVSNILNYSAPVQANGFMSPRIEIYLKMSGTVGVFQCWLNDQLIINFNGSVVGPGGETTFDTISIGSTRGSQYLYDDIAVNSTAGTVNNGRVGEGFVIPLFPNANGTFSQLTNSFNTSVDNFNFINRLPTNAIASQNNLTGFVGTNVSGNQDTYKLQNIPEEMNTVTAFKVSSYSVKNGPAISHLKAIVDPGPTPPSLALTATILALAGNIDVGTHEYVTTFIINTISESEPGPASISVNNTLGNQQNSLTAIPLGPTNAGGGGGTTARKVYRSKAGVPGVWYLLTTINDNTTTTYTDNTADASLGVNPPSELVAPAGPGLTLPIGGFGWVEQIFDNNPHNGGNVFQHIEMDQMEAGVQFLV